MILISCVILLDFLTLCGFKGEKMTEKENLIKHIDKLRQDKKEAEEFIESMKLSGKDAVKGEFIHCSPSYFQREIDKCQEVLDNWPEDGWKKVGIIRVDAGICWVGDPCYILHQDNPPEDIGKDWGEFVDKLYPTMSPPQYRQFNCDEGHPGLGVVVNTGYGDGYYPVEARLEDGRVAELRVKFIEPLDDGEKNA